MTARNENGRIPLENLLFNFPNEKKEHSSSDWPLKPRALDAPTKLCKNRNKFLCLLKSKGSLEKQTTETNTSEINARINSARFVGLRERHKLRAGGRCLLDRLLGRLRDGRERERENMKTKIDGGEKSKLKIHTK